MAALRPRELLAESPSLPLLLVAVGVVVWVGASDGGFDATTWYPGAALMLALVAVGLLALPRPRLSRAAAVAVGLLVAYGLWCGLSIAWADQQGVAWDAANRALMYALVLALFAAWPLSARAAVIVLGAVGLAVAGVALTELLRADAATHPSGYFLIARFAEPLGYANANVNFFFMAVFPCVFLASRRELPAPLRGLFLGAAGVLMGIVLLGQSRGWLFTLAPALVAFVLLVPGRGRLLIALLGLGAGVAAMSGPALDVFDQFLPGRSLAAPLDQAVTRILLVSGGLALLGTVAALLEGRVRVAPPAARRLNAAVLIGAAVVVLAVVVAATVRVGDPVEGVSDAWSEFKQGEPQDAFAGSRRLTASLSTSRYDQWRVAWENFEREPLIGVGADNYQQDYLERGDTTIKPRYPHSVELMALSETGLVGALLLFGALLTALFAVTRAVWRHRGESPLGIACAGAAASAALYWLLHASTDWLFELPALGGLAIALLGLALAASAPAEAGARSGRSRRRPLAGIAAAVAMVLVALSFLAPWLAAHDVKAASSGWRSDPEEAFDRLDRAAKLNPLSNLPDLTAGSIAVALDRLDDAEREFRQARALDPRDAYALFELGAIASEQGRRQEALRLLEAAQRRSPRDGITDAALERVRRGRRLDVSQLNDRIVEATKSRIAPG